jgi:hypothetical protein
VIKQVISEDLGLVELLFRGVAYLTQRDGLSTGSQRGRIDLGAGEIGKKDPNSEVERPASIPSVLSQPVQLLLTEIAFWGQEKAVLPLRACSRESTIEMRAHRTQKVGSNVAPNTVMTPLSSNILINIFSLIDSVSQISWNRRAGSPWPWRPVWTKVGLAGGQARWLSQRGLMHETRRYGISKNQSPARVRVIWLCLKDAFKRFLYL